MTCSPAPYAVRWMSRFSIHPEADCTKVVRHTVNLNKNQFGVGLESFVRLCVCSNTSGNSSKYSSTQHKQECTKIVHLKVCVSRLARLRRVQYSEIIVAKWRPKSSKQASGAAPQRI